MPLTLVFVALVVGALLLAVWLVPTQVRYTETLTIDAPARVLYDNTRLQTRLMQWSAWPGATGSTCALENTDGDVGARTVFFSKGQRFGHQEVTRLVDAPAADPEAALAVELAIVSKGPPQKPVLVVDFVPVSATRTRVSLHFTNTLARPFHVVLRAAGMVRWTRRMHVKDLQGLKRYSEPPFLTNTGQPVGP